MPQFFKVDTDMWMARQEDGQGGRGWEGERVVVRREEECENKQKKV